MAKITNRQRTDMLQMLQHLDRGIAYLMAPTTAVCRRTTGGTTLTYVRASDNARLDEVAKEYGSNLTGVFEARRLLVRFLESA